MNETVIERLQKVHLIVDEIKATSQEVAGLDQVTLDPFGQNVETLCRSYEPEYEKYRLDEIVVAAIAQPVSYDLARGHIRSTLTISWSQMRRLLSSWHPLQDPPFLAPTLRKWRKALRMSAVKVDDDQVAVYGVRNLSLNQAKMWAIKVYWPRKLD